MIALLHNRRKYTAGQVIPSGGGVWPDFDLSKLGAFISSVQLFDSTAAYSASYPLQCYNLLPWGADSDSILLNAQRQGHAYVYGFASGHSFELSHINNSFSSRTASYTTFAGIFPNPDATAIYMNHGGSTTIYYRPLSLPYNISNVGTSQTVLTASSGIISSVPNCIFISSDGLHLYYKAYSSNDFYVLDLAEAWPTQASSFVSLNKFSLSDFDSILPGTAPYTWRCFTFSPDGKCVVFTTNVCIVKFVLSVPWDFSSAVFHSYKSLANSLTLNGSAVNVYLGGVAINATGTRMILHNRAHASNASDAAAFYDFALSA